MADKATINPIEQFQQWFAEAEACEAIAEPTAMVLGTVDEHGLPDARVLLLKGVDERGLTFYTNLGSVKAQQLEAVPHAVMCFHWPPLERQVRVAGPVSRVSDEEADAYFASRPRQSQIGAWASKQSEPLEGRLELERRVARYAMRFAVGPVPRPPFWSGYRLDPLRIEFWRKRPFRLHERWQYTREDGNAAWTEVKLYP